VSTPAPAPDAGVAPALPWPALPPWLESVAADALAGRDSWPHALLIAGPRGVGKHALALYFAQALLCETPQPNGAPCGHCPGCRYAVAGQHPDLLRLELMTFEEGTGEWSSVDTISVDRVRALIDFALLSSHRQHGKVAVIAPAERMHPSAANALLKTLEEPPPGTFVILVSDQPGRLPATIVSRCRRFPVALPPEAQSRNWLAARGVADPAAALAQAGGAPLLALAHADAATQAERRTWQDALADPARLPVIALAQRIESAGKDFRRPRLALALDWLIAWTADLARVNAGGTARRNPECAAKLAALAPQVAPIGLFRYHRTLLRQRALLAHPLTPRLVAEALLLDYKALFR
jgi:DNA polymerase-3 subunit delta'